MIKYYILKLEVHEDIDEVRTWQWYMEADKLNKEMLYLGSDAFLNHIRDYKKDKGL